MKKKAIVLGIGILTLGILLCACHPGKGFGSKTAPGSSQTAGSSSATKEKGESSEQKEEEKEQEEQKQEIQGTINKIGSYLVLLVGDGEYQVMDFGEGVTTDGFAEGDQVKITYTGTLGDEEHTPVIVTMEKIN